MKTLWKAAASLALTGMLLTACGTGSGPAESPAAPGTTAPETSAPGAPTGADPDAAIEIGSIYEPGNLSNTGGGGQGGRSVRSRLRAAGYAGFQIRLKTGRRVNSRTQRTQRIRKGRKKDKVKKRYQKDSLSRLLHKGLKGISPRC